MTEASTGVESSVDWEQAARFLFDRLDDIDTLYDVYKDDHDGLLRAIGRVHQRRFEIATTDGYAVTFLPQGTD